jgi:hypothetical protein
LAVAQCLPCGSSNYEAAREYCTITPLSNIKQENQMKRYGAKFFKPTDQENLKNVISFEMIIEEGIELAKIIKRDFLRDESIPHHDMSTQDWNVRPAIVSECEIPMEIASLLVSSGTFEKIDARQLWLEAKNTYPELL